MAHSVSSEVNGLVESINEEDANMKVAYFAYIDRKVGPYFHATSFASAFSKLVDELLIVGLKDTERMLNFNRPKALRLLKRLQPDITWDIKLILRNALRIPREYVIIKREKPAVILLRYERYTFSIAMLAWFLKVPLIIEANGSAAFECNKFGVKGSYRLTRFFENRILNSAKAINVVSRELENFFIKNNNISKENINVIPNGVDLEKFKPVSIDAAKKQLGLANKFVVGYVGSFSPRHDLTTLIKAARIVKEKRDICLVLVGAGMLHSNIQRLVTEYELTDFVIFAGRVSHDLIPSYIGAMDVAVALFPPTGADQFHGSPIKIFEYMAMKKAIITTRIGQLEELITDGFDGFLVDQQDEKAVAGKIITLAKDECLRTRLGENAYNTVVKKGYTWEENAKRTLQVCKEVMQRHKKADWPQEYVGATKE